MKKTLIALAALAATGAFAQSTVTMTGLVGFAHQQHRSQGATLSAGSGSGFTNTDATFALTASEDLGGGMRASGTITFDSSSAAFGQAQNRRNTNLTLAGGFGSIRLDNTRSGDLLNNGMVAPANLPEGMYNRSGIIGRAAVDALTYSLPAMSGFTPYAQYVESGADGSVNKLQRTYVAGGSYAAGPLTAGVAYKMNKNPGSALTPFKNNLEGFATYNLGVALIGVGFDSKRSDAESAATSFGISVPMGALTLGANYASRKIDTTTTNKVTQLVAKYDLSRRTNINFSWGNMTADATSPTTGVDGKQHRLGIYHSF